jgi:pyrimidine operon attenuation protein/uracil phosphoribosyltransferase
VTGTVAAAAEAVTLGDTVGELLGVNVTGTTGSARGFADLAGLALRDNPRRAHLVVSRVLGKHVPARPRYVLGMGRSLGEAVSAVLGGALGPAALVIGYCETATGLGHAVAARLGANYLHTTRRPHPEVSVTARFDEEHSHAVAHLLQPDGHVSLVAAGPVVLVDDELTSGTTALNTIAALQARRQRDRYVVAVLLDARTDGARAAFTARVAELGVRVEVVSVLSAQLVLPADVLTRAAAVRSALPAAAVPPFGRPAEIRHHRLPWPAAVPVTARHGMTAGQTVALDSAASDAARWLAGRLEGSRSVLVLGTEELMYLPTLLADYLDRCLPGATVAVQSTTRSPVHAADAPGYAVRRAVTFQAPDDQTRTSRVHNLADPGALPVDGRPWAQMRSDDVVVVVDAAAADCAGLVEALRPFADRAVHLVTVPPAGPAADRS